jgi:Na+/H+-dicarboxylate symporter
MIKNKLFSTENLTLLSIIAGILFGIFLPEIAINFELLGSLFLSLLKMLIVPLIFASIFMAILNIGNVEQLKNIGSKAFIYYFSTTALAVIMGIIIVNLINPGYEHEITTATLNTAPQVKEFSIADFILSFVPTNIVNSLANGSIIQIIFFTILLAVATLYLNDEKQTPLRNFFDSLNEAMMKLAHWVIALTPVGVFGLVSYVVADKGLESLINLGEYVFAVLLALFIHAIVTLPVILYFVTKTSPFAYFMQVREAVLLALSSASSSATLPVSIDVAKNRGGVSKKSAGFILPLGATVNMDGTALYESIAVIFIANLAGVDLSFGQQIIIFVTATLAAIGAAGIPGAGLVMMVVVLDAVGLPTEYIAVIMVVDRVLDSFRTATNVWGDLIGAKVLDKVIRQKS